MELLRGQPMCLGAQDPGDRHQRTDGKKVTVSGHGAILRVFRKRLVVEAHRANTDRPLEAARITSTYVMSGILGRQHLQAAAI